MDAPAEDGMEEQRVDELVEVLQRERDLLERLRFRFVGLGLMLDAAEVRFLDWTVHDVQLARHRAREADLVRAALVGSLRLETGDAAPSLREVAAAAPSPWAGMLRDHHEGLCHVVADIEMHSHHIAQSCRDGLATLARTGSLDPAVEVITVGGGGPVTTLGGTNPGSEGGTRGVSTAADLDPLVIERVLSEVLAATSRLRMPALLAFLR